MLQIDFLPSRFRQETVHRKANVWRILVAVVFAAALLASAVYQQLLRHGTERELARVGEVYEQANALASRLAGLQNRLRQADAEADLLTYLRHPWPTSQLLAAALAPLPDCLTLDEIHLTREQPASSGSSAPLVLVPPHGATSGDGTEKKKAAPAQCAAALLRKEYDNRPVVLILSGLTSDTASLQHYLVTLGEVHLFSKVELTSLETSGGENAHKLRFAARLVVRSGVGQSTSPQDGKGARPMANLPRSSPSHWARGD